MKGLLMRAATICNTVVGFKKAVEYYPGGLLLRECSKSFLVQSGRSFVSSNQQHGSTEHPSKNPRRFQEHGPRKVEALVAGRDGVVKLFLGVGERT